MAKAKTEAKRLRLPTEPEEPGGSFDDYAFFFHGEYKIGKTTLANIGESVLFLQCDPPQKAYRRIERVLPNWEASRDTFRELCKLAKRKRFPYTRVVIDGADLWYQHCSDYICSLLGVSHPADLDWGRGWGAVRREFTTFVLQFLSLPCSRWFISHSQWRQTEDRHGRKIDLFVPRITGQAEDIVLGRCDGVFCYDYDEKGRVIRLQESGGCLAGHRLDSEENPHFRHRKTRKPLVRIRVDGDAQFAHDCLVAAFDNKYPKRRSA